MGSVAFLRTSSRKRCAGKKTGDGLGFFHSVHCTQAVPSTRYMPSNSVLYEFDTSQFKGAYMSNAKWRKFFTLMAAPELALRQVIWKMVDGKIETRDPLPPVAYLHEKYTTDGQPFAYVNIEWIELPHIGLEPGFENVTSRSWKQDVEKALNVLRAAGEFEIVQTERGARVYGYR
jgi:hypothetical protein